MNMVKTVFRALGRVRAALRRAAVIAVRATFRVWSPSLDRRVRLSDIWDSPQYEGGRRYLVSEQWQEIERQCAELAEAERQRAEIP